MREFTDSCSLQQTSSDLDHNKSLAVGSENDNDGRHQEEQYSQTFSLKQNNADEINTYRRIIQLSQFEAKSSHAIKKLTLTTAHPTSSRLCDSSQEENLKHLLQDQQHLDDWNSNDSLRELLLDIATDCPDLQELSLTNMGMVHSSCQDSSLPLHLLNVLLSNHDAPLRHVHLNCVSLFANTTDVEEMAHQLQSIPQRQLLESFHMSYCGLEMASTIEPSTTTIATELGKDNQQGMHCSLDPIVNALSTLPNLQSIELWAFADGKLGTLQPRTLERLIRDSTKLQSLHLEGFILQDDHVQAIANALLSDDTKENCPTTSLQRLDLHKLQEASIGSLVLAEALRYNTSLQYLELFLANSSMDNNGNGSNKNNNDDEDGLFLTKLAQSLTDNSTLRELRIHSYRNVTVVEEECFATMLETNRTLQYLHLAGYEGDNRPKLEYYLSWNRRGRHPASVIQEKSCQISAMVKSRQQEAKEKSGRGGDPQKRKKKRRARRLMKP